MTTAERQASMELLARAYRTRWCPHMPTPKQRAFVDYGGLEALYGGAAGGGKSDALLMSALRYVHVPGYAALLLRRTFADLNLENALMDRARKWLEGTSAHWDGLNKRWSFPAPATLTFGYLENAGDETRYQSAEFQAIGFDELSQFPERQYTYMFSRLRKRAGVEVPLRMRAATNPGGIGHAWVKHRFITQPAQRLFVPATIDDNPHIDKAEYERALAELDSVTFAQLRHGSWEQDTSTLVYAFREEHHTVDALPPGAWYYVLGIDYGNVDATAMCVLAFNAQLTDVCYVVESDKWKGLDPYGAAEIVAQWMARYPFVQIVGDVGGLGKGYAEEARNRFGLPIEPAQKQNKLGYIKLMNGAFERSKLKIVRAGNEKLIAEYKALPWKDDTRQAELPGAENHLSDAALYGFREVRGFEFSAKPKAPPPGSPEYFAAIERQAEREDEESIIEQQLEDSYL